MGIITVPALIGDEVNPCLFGGFQKVNNISKSKKKSVIIPHLVKDLVIN